MGQLKNMGIVLFITWLLIFTIPISENAIDEIDFKETNVYSLEDELSSEYKLFTEDGVVLEYYFLEQRKSIIRIDEINSGNKIINYTHWWGSTSAYQGKGNLEISFASNCSEEMLLFRPFFFEYNDEPKFMGFYHRGERIQDPALFPLFIDPDWKNVNENLVKTLDNDTIVFISGDTVITFGEFINNTSSIDLMGYNDLESGLNAFTDTTHRWEVKLVFDSGIYFDYGLWLNGLEEFDYYEATFEIEYTKGGTLKNSKITTNGTIEENLSIETKAIFSNIQLNIDSSESLVSPGFEFSTVFLAIVLFSFNLKAIKERIKKIRQ